ncbi:MAG: TVP38/TMEM64 family protein [Acidobacteriota bacterium]
MATKPKKRSIPWKWLGLGVAVIGLFVAWRLLPIKDWLQAFQSWIAGLGPWGGVLYALAYVVAALLFVPGIVLTLGAGYVFGLGWGVVIVSVASTAAAAGAFLIARYLARERVEKLARGNEKFQAIDRAIGENGWKVVGLLRLSPLIPFSVSNYLYGLTAVKFWPYMLASWVGMLPATFLYVYLGAAGKTAGEKGGRSPWEWVLLGGGLLATVAVTVILTRFAKKQLGRKRVGA